MDAARSAVLRRATVRHAAAAFTAGAVIALFFDAVLHFLASTIRVSAVAAPMRSARVTEHLVWIALGLVFWLAAPLVGEWMDDVTPGAGVSRRTVWQLTGLAMLTLPLGHLLAQWIVLATQLTITRTWDPSGRIFLSGAYHGAVLLSITPWIAAGAVVRGWAHHMLRE